jgi:hypothetical protein
MSSFRSHFDQFPRPTRKITGLQGKTLNANTLTHINQAWTTSNRFKGLIFFVGKRV